MQRLKQKPIALLVLAVGIALAAMIAGRSVLAQGAVPADDGERTEGTAGKTGRIDNLTEEQLSLLQPDDLNAIYHFAGALNDTFSAVEKATVVQCTNVDDTDTTDIELQLFDYDALSVYTGTVSIDPLETATFESTQVEFYTADVFMDAGFVEQGLGRILSTHDRVVCTVQTVDPINDPPAWGFDIPLYAGPFNQAMLPVILKDGAS